MGQTEEQKEVRKIPQVMPTRRHLAEVAIRHHVVTVEDASHPSDFLEPEFWSLVAKEFTIGDRVEVRDDAMTFWGEYIVLSCDSTWAKLQELRRAKLSPEPERDEKSDFFVQWKGPLKKHCVLRKSDKSVIKEGLATRIEATAALIDYERLVGKKAA